MYHDGFSRLFLYECSLSVDDQLTFRFYDVFRGYRKATPGCNGLSTLGAYLNAKIFGWALARTWRLIRPGRLLKK